MIRVVIAEDDRSVARTLSRVMTTMGYHPVICSDGLRALHVIEDNPDTRLLITDVSMPHMDGRELLHCIRGKEKLSTLPTIIISALVSVAEISHLIDSDITHFLGKPINIEDLRELARNLIEHGKVSLE